MKHDFFLSRESSSFLLFLISCVLLFHSSIGTTAEPRDGGFVVFNCSADSYAANSVFATNLNNLFSSLRSKSSNSISGNDTEGEGTDRVYGLFLCLGDLPHESCQGCIQTAISDISQNCSYKRQGVIWYDYCLLRYSDDNFFGVVDANGSNYTNPVGAPQDSTEPLKMMSKIVEEAPYVPLKFESFSLGPENEFGMAQCTSDLSSEGCERCLATALAAIKACCASIKGWRYVTPSCWIRYEITFFLQPVDPNNRLGSFNCTGDVYDAHSTYQTNLGNLFLSLIAKSFSSESDNDTIGDEPDSVHGLFLCQATLSASDCQNCIRNATSDIQLLCSRTQGIIWYDYCQLRYSNVSFFGVADTEGFYLTNPDVSAETNSTEPVDMVSKLVQEAPNTRPLMFASNSSPSASLYGMAECTMDLNSTECGRCLRTILEDIKGCCTHSGGWRYLSPSCWIRYESTSFFDVDLPPSGGGEGGGGSGGGVGGNKKSWKKVVAIAAVAASAGIFLLSTSIYFLWNRRSRRRYGRFYDKRHSQLEEVGSPSNKDLPVMDLRIIQAATRNFSDDNKLGEGGFGPVYRGILPNGKVIAVKRLSTRSRQGTAEFKNEVKLIAKIQHRNLVRILGYCIEKEERLLVYEYLEKKSLDAFLFDSERRSQLDWRRRLHIIAGIARGLLYLHEDSLLTVIHRDLKASNVLLDSNMNPKISDFGMAKIFEGELSEANASRIVGTYGYIAPEYAMDGIFSVKSDVFSFGVLLLEILCGQRNGDHHQQHGRTLLRSAWELWNQARGLELIDPLLRDSYSPNEASRCMHIGLLCVQESVEERPTMSLVVTMMRSDEMVLPEPSEPPSYVRRGPAVPGASSMSAEGQSTKRHSINEVTLSSITGR